MSETIKRRSAKSLTIFGLILIPIVATWLLLIFQIPISFLRGGGIGYWVNQKTQLATIHTGSNTGSEWTQTLTLDVSTGAISKDDLETTALNRARMAETDRSVIKGDGEGHWKLSTIDVSRGEARSELEFEFPVAPTIVGGRFLVGMNKANIWCRDATNPDGELVQVKNQSDCWYDSPICIGDSNRFFRINYLVPPPPGFLYVDLFEIDDQSKPTLVAAIPTMINPADPRTSVTLVDDEIVVLNPNSSEIEFHSVVDGRLVDSIQLLEGMDTTANRWSLNHDLFWIDFPEATRYFDLRKKSWIPLPKGKFILADSSPDGQLWLAYHREGSQFNKAVLIDKEQNKIVSRFERFTTVEFLDNKSVLTLSPYWGTTLQRIATKDGSIVQSWSPYWWAVPVLLASILAFVVWSLGWLRQTGSGSLSIWVTIAVLGGIPALMFVFRTKFVGDPIDFARGPIHYAQGVIFAWLLLSTVWMVNSRQRIVIRVLPLMVTIAVLFAAVAFLFSKDAYQIIVGVVQMLIPVFLYLFSCFVFKRFGFCLLPPTSESETSESTSGVSGGNLQGTLAITIKDMFLLMTGVALVFATLNPLLPSLVDSLGNFKRLLDGVGHLTVACIIQMSAWWLAMSGRKFHWARIMFFVILLGLLIAMPLYRFVTGDTTIINLVYRLNLSPELVRVAATSSLATFWMALAFRSAGWTWARSVLAKI